MKKIFFPSIAAIALVVVSFTSCVKSTDSYGTQPNCTDVSVTMDSAALFTFATANGIGPLQDTAGLYYQIVAPGTGVSPGTTSTVFVTYTAKLMNGTIFDSTTNSASTGFTLGNLIPGWQLGLPLIKVGGHIRLLVPSAYGYGCEGSGTVIPANAPLYFDITLVSVN